MVATDRARELFDDARGLHADALRRLEAGDIRDAAEKAWGATKRATDALILARTAQAPQIMTHNDADICRYTRLGTREFGPCLLAFPVWY
jgi:hypothetical protein